MVIANGCVDTGRAILFQSYIFTVIGIHNLTGHNVYEVIPGVPLSIDERCLYVRQHKGFLLSGELPVPIVIGQHIGIA